MHQTLVPSSGGECGCGGGRREGEPEEEKGGREEHTEFKTERNSNLKKKTNSAFIK